MSNVELWNSYYFIFKIVARSDIHNSSIDIRHSISLHTSTAAGCQRPVGSKKKLHFCNKRCSFIRVLNEEN